MPIKKPTEGLSKWVKFSGLGLQMGATIYVGSLIGGWLDEKYPNDYVSYFKVVTLFVVFGSMFTIIREVIRMSKEDEKKSK